MICKLLRNEKVINFLESVKYKVRLLGWGRGGKGNGINLADFFWRLDMYTIKNKALITHHSLCELPLGAAKLECYSLKGSRILSESNDK